MGSESSDRDPVEAALEAKVTAWTTALESYRAAKAMDGAASADVPMGVVGGASGRSMDLPVGVFRDKGVKEAITIYLEAARRKQTNKEIATGLIKGGIATTAGNFEATVATALLRLKREGVVLRFVDGWDLAASYPDSLKNRLEKDTRPTPAKKRNGKKRSAAKAAKRKQPQARRKPQQPNPKLPPTKTAAARPSGPGLEQRVKDYLTTRQTSFTSVDELVAQLHLPNAQVLRLALGKLAKQQVIEKDDEGRVRLVKKVA
jgi:hypothetical protein